MWGLFTDGPDYQIFISELRARNRLADKDNRKVQNRQQKEFNKFCRNSKGNFKGVRGARMFTRAIGYK